MDLDFPSNLMSMETLKCKCSAPHLPPSQGPKERSALAPANGSGQPEARCDMQSPG